MKSEKQLLADKLVKKFIDNYYNIIGTKPIVSYSVKESIHTLNEIYNVVNEAFKLKEKQDDISISDINREPSFVLYRNIYFSIARDHGYSLNSIGKLVNKDHATVYHGCKCISETSILKKELKEKLMLINK